MVPGRGVVRWVGARGFGLMMMRRLGAEDGGASVGALDLCALRLRELGWHLIRPTFLPSDMSRNEFISTRPTLQLFWATRSRRRERN